MKVRATVITPIERDHLAALGGSLESIALSKVGILKPGGLVVVAEQPLADAYNVVKKHAKSLGFKIVRGSSMTVTSEGFDSQGTASASFVAETLVSSIRKLYISVV